MISADQPPSFDKEWLASELTSLPHRHCVAFAASCCERMILNYAAFSREEDWGDVDLLRQALDAVWRYAGGRAIAPQTVSDMVHACDESTPDIDDFESPLKGAALYAATAIAEALESLGSSSVEKQIQIASYAIDTVFEFIGHPNERYTIEPPRLEQEIMNDPLMIAELEHQRDDIARLKQKITPDDDFLWELRRRSSRSNLGLS